MKCRILFSGKNEKNISNLSSAELAQRAMRVNGLALSTALKVRDLLRQMSTV